MTGLVAWFWTSETWSAIGAIVGGIAALVSAARMSRFVLKFGGDPELAQAT
jgi:hypothetical protein